MAFLLELLFGDPIQKSTEYSFSTYEDGVTIPENQRDEDEDWKERLSNWDTLTSDFPNEAFLLVRDGIPSTIRGQAWKIMSGASFLIDKNPGVFECLLERSSESEEILRKDVHRTFPRHKHFKLKEGDGQHALFNVLKAYSVMDPEVGYCQGMSFLCGVLVCYVSSEVEAFWVMVSMLKKYGLRGQYETNLPLLQKKTLKD